MEDVGSSVGTMWAVQLGRGHVRAMHSCTRMTFSSVKKSMAETHHGFELNLQIATRCTDLFFAKTLCLIEIGKDNLREAQAVFRCFTFRLEHNTCGCK